MKRYSAKLFFCIHVESLKRQTCEERIISVSARSAREALNKVKRKGRAATHKYKNTYGEEVRVKFLGVIELLCFESLEPKEEVWYELVERLYPEKRLAEFIPPEENLSAIRHND